MCNTTGPKFFLPPAQLGSYGAADAPLAYASNPQATFDAGNPGNFPKPTPVTPPTLTPPTAGPLPKAPMGNPRYYGGAGQYSNMRRALMS